MANETTSDNPETHGSRLQTMKLLEHGIVDPTVNDDLSAKFYFGSVFVNTATGKAYLCIDNTTGAAVWVQTAGARASEKSWAFSSPTGGGQNFFVGGFYQHETGDDNFNPSATLGTANTSYAAHVYFVAAAGGAGGTDTVVRVTGTSITDTGTRTAADTEDVTLDDAGAAGAYYETSKKFIGQVTIAKQSGPDLLCNFGWAKYWDNNNTDFTVKGLEVTWLSGADDSPNILLRHHKTTGWTYNAGGAGEATPPTAIADMNTDHNTEIDTEISGVTGEHGAWKRTNLDTDVSGSGSEGTIWEIQTSVGNTFRIGNILMRIEA